MSKPRTFLTRQLKRSPRSIGFGMASTPYRKDMNSSLAIGCRKSVAVGPINDGEMEIAHSNRAHFSIIFISEDPPSFLAFS